MHIKLLNYEIPMSAPFMCRALGVITGLLDIFHKQEIEPDKMDYIVIALKAVMDLREDPIDDVRCVTDSASFSLQPVLLIMN